MTALFLADAIAWGTLMILVRHYCVTRVRAGRMSITAAGFFIGAVWALAFPLLEVTGVSRFGFLFVSLGAGLAFASAFVGARILLALFLRALPPKPEAERDT